MTETTPRNPLEQPRQPRRLTVDVDREAFGRFSERLARFMGTGTFLLFQTVIVVLWIAINLAAASLRWDPYPFILLNLAFSTQAAYAAPLILLAQNRQDDRDRVALAEDRMRAARTKSDTEFLARELAGLRIALREIASRDDLRDELDRLRAELAIDVGPDQAIDSPRTSEALTDNHGRAAEQSVGDPARRHGRGAG